MSAPNGYIDGASYGESRAPMPAGPYGAPAAPPAPYGGSQCNSCGGQTSALGGYGHQHGHCCGGHHHHDHHRRKHCEACGGRRRGRGPIGLLIHGAIVGVKESYKYGEKKYNEHQQKKVAANQIAGPSTDRSLSEPTPGPSSSTGFSPEVPSSSSHDDKKGPLPESVPEDDPELPAYGSVVKSQ